MALLPLVCTRRRLASTQRQAYRIDTFNKIGSPRSLMGQAHSASMKDHIDSIGDRHLNPHDPVSN
jgi:hypothetical protein